MHYILGALCKIHTFAKKWTPLIDMQWALTPRLSKWGRSPSMIPETERTPKVKVGPFVIKLRTELLTPWSWPAWCRAPGPRPPWRGWGGRPAEARACWTLASSLGPAAFIPGPGARTQQQNLGSIKTIKQSWILQGDEWEDAWSAPPPPHLVI